MDKEKAAQEAEKVIELFELSNIYTFFSYVIIVFNFISNYAKIESPAKDRNA